MAAFPDTQWSLIRRSLQSSSTRVAAFSQLTRDYRPAIVAFFRARLPDSGAEDAVQSFLELSFEHQWWGRADVGSGSFRGFLLMLLHRHLGHIRNRRGVPADVMTAAEHVPDPSPEPDRSFDTRFALLLTQRALARLRDRYRARGRETLFETLTELLVAPPEHGEARRVADRLGLAPNTLTVELKRVRARLHDALHDELRDLCVDEASFEAEWISLQSILDGR